MAVDSQSVPSEASCALVMGGSAQRANLVAAVEAMGLSPGEADDPYAAMAELCRQPDSYRALVLSLAGLYREELQIIPTVKNRFPHVEIWLADMDGRSATLAEAMRLGADGLLGEDGLHRLGEGSPADGASSRGAVVADAPVPVKPAASEQLVQAVRSMPSMERIERANGDHNGANPDASPAGPKRVAADRRDRAPARAQESDNATPAEEPSPRRRRRQSAASAVQPPPTTVEPANEPRPFGSTPDEPVLTAEELRALLQDQPGVPPLGRE